MLQFFVGSNLMLFSIEEFGMAMHNASPPCNSGGTGTDEDNVPRWNKSFLRGSICCNLKYITVTSLPNY